VDSIPKNQKDFRNGSVRMLNQGAKRLARESDGNQNWWPTATPGSQPHGEGAEPAALKS